MARPPKSQIILRSSDTIRSGVANESLIIICAGPSASWDNLLWTDNFRRLPNLAGIALRSTSTAAGYAHDNYRVAKGTDSHLSVARSGSGRCARLSTTR